LAAGCFATLANALSGAEGAPHLLNYFTSWPWTGVTGGAVVSGNHLLPENGGITVTFSFLNPLTGVNVSVPASPNASSASPSYFGLLAGSGLGVSDTTTGYFNTGEQFSLQANHKFALKELQFDEYTADEALHIGWTQNGAAKSAVLTLGLVAGGRIDGRNIVYPVPSGTTIVADAGTPIRITNVSSASSDSAGRLRLVRMMTAPVFAQTPTYSTAGTDGYEQMFGVNLAGGDGGSLPGKLDTDYHYPKRDGMDYFNRKELKLIRVPFRWQRIQPVLYGPLSTADVNELERVVTDAEDRGMKVILDMHDYGGRGSQGKIGSLTVTRDHFKDVWKKIAGRFKGRPGIYGYGLSNEPNGMGSNSWPLAAQAGADGIREVDHYSWIIVGGENYSKSSEWIKSNANLDVQDAYGRLMYEAHTYFNESKDGAGYGTYATEHAHDSRGIYYLEPFVRWLKQRNARGFLGEYGAPNDGDSRWLTVLQNYMKYAGANGLSGTYWLAGAWVGGDLNSVQPTVNYTVDKPQMAVLAQNYAYGYVRPEIIVDNSSFNPPPPGWTLSTSTVGLGPSYGSNYLHDGDTGQGTKSILFVPNVRSPDFYEVSAWWRSYSNRASNTPIDVISASGVSPFEVDQTVNGGQWVPLDTLPFAGGQGGGVQISNDGTDGFVIADAIRLRKSIATTIIMDNADAGVTYTGTWSSPSSATTGYVGTGYIHDSGNGKGTKTALFTPNIPVSGKYEVFVRWTSDDNRSPRVPVQVNYNGGSFTDHVDQTYGGGLWYSLGIHPFVQGTSGSVKITNADTSGIVVVDAVRFHKR
jgi:endoglucanase